MSRYQPGILDALPKHAIHLFFNLEPETDIPALLANIQRLAQGQDVVCGLGAPLLQGTHRVSTYKDYPALTGSGLALPSTPSALWCWLRGEERGDLLQQARHWVNGLKGHMVCQQQIDCFLHHGNRDLSGYEDGTENPEGDAALDTAVVQGTGDGLDGGSFAVIQQWQHQFDRLAAMSQTERDHCIGRRQSDNEELDDAPDTAHVKRTAQESFSPEAFLWRRSMPWAAQQDAGLVFLAFARDFRAFEAQMQRMLGQEDGQQDALFRFTRPLTGAYFWCPPLKAGKLDFSALNA